MPSLVYIYHPPQTATVVHPPLRAVTHKSDATDGGRVAGQWWERGDRVRERTSVRAHAMKQDAGYELCGGIGEKMKLYGRKCFSYP